MVTIEEAKNLRNKIDVTGTVSKIGESRNVNLRTGGTTFVTDVTLIDETGSIILQVWGETIHQIRQGSKVTITNGYTNTFKNSTSLGVGKFGKLTVN